MIEESEKNNTVTLDKTIAVALEYSGEGAPVVTAKGTGHLARHIIDIAEENSIPIKPDDQLVELLSQVELDEEIPEILYEAVVQVLIFAYQVSGKMPYSGNK